MTTNDIDRQLEDLRDLQEKIDAELARVERLQSGITFHGDPRAKVWAEILTVKQHWLLNSLDMKGADSEAECRRLFGCEVASLNKRAASCLIDYLKKEKL